MIVYLDDSYSADHTKVYLSALIIPVATWLESLKQIQALRSQLRNDYGVYVRKEIHCRDFVAGRGKIGTRTVPKRLRRTIYREQILPCIVGLPGARLMNATAPRKKADIAFEWLCNRIERTMKSWGCHAILFCDEGKEAHHTAIKRRMGVHNQIPSMYGEWLDGSGATKSIPIERIVEDPIFLDSSRSLFVQMADCCVYAFMCWDRPVQRHSIEGLDKCFPILEPLFVKEATRYDKLGIIRVP